jgi:head-tail adaptor
MGMSREFAGRLRERVVIEAPMGERNAIGAQLPSWEVVARCLAMVAPEGVGAEAEGQALSAMARFRVTIRVRDGIKVGQRLRWAGRLLSIRQRIDDPALPDRITLRCEEMRA